MKLPRYYWLVIGLVLASVGCESVTGIMDDWFTQDPPDVSDAERLDDSLGWMIPSPWRELTSAIVGGLAVFWTQKRKKPAK